MVINDAKELRLLGRKLRIGDARITGTITIQDEYPDRYYVLDDLTDQVTLHVATIDRPTWSRYMEVGR